MSTTSFNAGAPASAGSQQQQINKPIVVVACATGLQGSSVAAALINDGSFHVRGLTRNAKTDKAQKLRARFPTLELVEAELKDQKRMEEVLRGAHSFFLVTQFWEKLDEGEEFKQGKAAIDAAVAAKVEQVVLSTLPSAQLLTQGKLRVPHFDAKWKIADYLRMQQGIKWTFFFMSYYMENLMNPALGPRPRVGSDQKEDRTLGLQFEYGLNGKPFAIASVRDIGPVLLTVFKANPLMYHGTIIELVGQILTVNEMVGIYKSVTGNQNAVCCDLDVDGYKKLPGAMAELGDMYALFQRIADLRQEAKSKNWSNPFTSLLGMPANCLIDARTLASDRKLTTFEDWLRLTGWMQQHPHQGQPEQQLQWGSGVQQGQQQGQQQGLHQGVGVGFGGVIRKPIIAVTGATGKQGGSVVAYLYRDGRFQVRAITRDPRSKKAQVMAQQYPNIEIAKAELTDKASMVQALQGCAGLFLVTQFWEKMDEKYEIQQGTTAIDAAVEAKVPHILLSALPSAPLLSDNKLRVPHFDGKWKIAEHLQQQFKSVNWTIMFVPYYYENFMDPVFGPKLNANGQLEFLFALEGKSLAMASVTDTGRVALSIFTDPARYNHKLVDLVGDVLSPLQIIQIYSNVTRTTCIVKDVDVNTFARSPGGSLELGNMFLLAQIIDNNRHRRGWTDPYTQALHLPADCYINARNLHTPVHPLTFQHWLTEFTRAFERGAAAVAEKAKEKEKESLFAGGSGTGTSAGLAGHPKHEFTPGASRTAVDPDREPKLVDKTDISSMSTVGGPVPSYAAVQDKKQAAFEKATHMDDAIAPPLPATSQATGRGPAHRCNCSDVTCPGGTQCTTIRAEIRGRGPSMEAKLKDNTTVGTAGTTTKQGGVGGVGPGGIGSSGVSSSATSAAAPPHPDVQMAQKGAQPAGR